MQNHLSPRQEHSEYNQTVHLYLKGCNNGKSFKNASLIQKVKGHVADLSGLWIFERGLKHGVRSHPKRLFEREVSNEQRLTLSESTNSFCTPLYHSAPRQWLASLQWQLFSFIRPHNVNSFVSFYKEVKYSHFR